MVIKLNHTRTQWAVGHGFFHSATIECDKEFTFEKENNLKKFIYVYDCGGKKKGVYEREIEEFFIQQGGKISDSIKKIPINMLVISHFHADHINGIPHLLKYFTIKNLVIPHLKPNEKKLAILELCEMIDNDDDNLRGLIEFINNPRSLLENENEVNIIEISSNDDEDSTRSHDENSYIKFPQGNIIWEFRFYYNNKVDKDILQKIDRELKDYDFSNAKSIEENFEDIKKKYKDIVKSPKMNSINLSMRSNVIGRMFNISMDSRFYCNWLGTGDAELETDESMTNFLIHMLKDFGISKIHSSRFNWQADFSRVDFPQRPFHTITVPHHGSKDNYNTNFMDKLAYNYVFTVPENSQKHPDPNIKKSLENIANIALVTNDNNDRLYENYEFVVVVW